MSREMVLVGAISVWSRTELGCEEASPRSGIRKPAPRGASPPESSSASHGHQALARLMLQTQATIRSATPGNEQDRGKDVREAQAALSKTVERRGSPRSQDATTRPLLRKRARQGGRAGIARARGGGRGSRGRAGRNVAPEPAAGPAGLGHSGARLGRHAQRRQDDTP